MELPNWAFLMAQINLTKNNCVHIIFSTQLESFLNGPSRASFSFIFVVSNITNFATIKCEKMHIQYTMQGFELTICGERVSSHIH